MSELRVAGVRLDLLLAMQPGEVIDAVPESHRQYFRYWRGAHLGKIALNLMRGRMVINAGESDNLIFFSDQYSDGSRIATRLAGPPSRYRSTDQWNERDAQRFSELTGHAAPDHFGGVVMAARYMGEWPNGKGDPGWGYSVDAPVGFHEIDPYTLQALEDLFDVDLLTPPEAVGPDSPPGPAPIRDEDMSTFTNRPWADYLYMPGQRPRTGIY